MSDELPQEAGILRDGIAIGVTNTANGAFYPLIVYGAVINDPIFAVQIVDGNAVIVGSVERLLAWGLAQYATYVGEDG